MWNAGSARGGSHERGGDKPECALLVEETRQDLGAPALLDEPALDEVGRARVDALGHEQPQVRERRLRT